MEKTGNMTQRLKFAGIAFSLWKLISLLNGYFYNLMISNVNLRGFINIYSILNYAVVFAIIFICAEMMKDPLRDTLRLRLPRLPDVLLSIALGVTLLAILCISNVIFDSTTYFEYISYINFSRLLGLIPGVLYWTLLFHGLETKFKPRTVALLIALSAKLYFPLNSANGSLPLSYWIQYNFSELLSVVVVCYLVYRSKSVFCGIIFYYIYQTISLDLIDMNIVYAADNVLLNVIINIGRSALDVAAIMLVIRVYHKVTQKRLQLAPESSILEGVSGTGLQAQPSLEPKTKPLTGFAQESESIPDAQVYAPDHQEQMVSDTIPGNEMLLWFVPGLLCVVVQFLI